MMDPIEAKYSLSGLHAATPTETAPITQNLDKLFPVEFLGVAVSLTDSCQTSVTLHNLDFVAASRVGRGILFVASEGRDDNMVGG
ncbi:hypothetical protein D8674_039918 [Pyrus ussuriensis x Pyrus communis]|uniref:Uncharacterized protein n=1 Tax=Pyrus ussuriensis x Pyrus communis TaxID=2448454 RepID=A0A5N5H6W8_9ROSA|nr:hypothetical protein D8674_039918 [Pyrus ussuriensis x Pyrus communis]